MCQDISRRAWLGTAAGIAASIAGVPAALSALETRLSHSAAAPDDLEIALKAERWIRRSRIETKNGVTWPADPLKPTSVGYDLYNGMPGVVLFYLELYRATGDELWLDEAKRGANELEAQLPTLATARNAGLYTGLGGAVFVLEETHRASTDGRYRDAARKALGMIHSLAQKSSSGAAWTGPSATNDIISGTAGIGLLLLWADHMMDDAPSRTLALAAGRQLLAAVTMVRACSSSSAR